MEHGTQNIKRGKENSAPQGAARKGLFPSASCSMLHASYSQAFSLVETVVAIAILAVSVVAPISLAQKSLNASSYAKDQVTAFYLAQEAMEYVRNVRDNNNLSGFSGNDWLSGLSDCINVWCGLDVTADGSTYPRTFPCVLGTDCLLTFNPSIGVYGVRRNPADAKPISGWQDSIFTRKIRIVNSAASSADEAGVEVSVNWSTGLLAKNFTLKTKIFNWFPN